MVGAGHAGCEAAHASAVIGAKVLLITMDMNKIAQMSCNPAIGGIAKGQIVREIDALGGMTGIITDATSIQRRMLNRSKGPAMWSPRAQSDRMAFSLFWRGVLEKTPNLSIWQDSVTELLFESTGAVSGVKTALGMSFQSKAVILTAGTFLNGLMHIGRTKIPGGRVSEAASHGLTEQLCSRGIKTDRMKTGTPPRINGNSVDWSLVETQQGDQDFHKFSFLPDLPNNLTQRPCYILHTNEQTHQILRDSLPESPLYNGQITSIGPRYCPSIETKIVTFADKTSHQLFLEPEGETTCEFYLNGFSTSLPINTQLQALKTIPALRNVEIYRPGYAIEYDFFDPTLLRHTLESQIIPNLYLAGQVNGTTGYEEAAGQGLMAGINAALNIQNQEPLVLHRDQAYIGVLIDDLVSKGVDEPYRMFTSRAEYRILLRQDNADARLTQLGHSIGLASDERLELWNQKQTAIKHIISLCSSTSVTPSEANPLLLSNGESPISQATKLHALVLRPNLSLSALAEISPELKATVDSLPENRRDEILESAEIAMKYEGYISREKENAAKLMRLENVTLKDKLDYNNITALSTEARQKLTLHQPDTVGQASRIPGVSPADINILLLLLGS